MAIVSRKRRNGTTVHYVVLTWQGKPVWEKVGPNKREAQSVESQRKKEIEAGTYQPRSGTRAMTLRQWAASWFATRNVRSVSNEQRWIRLHVLPRAWAADKPIAEWDTQHADQLLRELRAEGKLADKSIANLFGVLVTMWGAAIRAKLCLSNPFKLEKKTLNRDPEHEREIYSHVEVRLLTRHVEVPWPIRVLNALCLLGGLREGEACGRRWRDLHVDVAPLWCLSVRDQYDGEPLKTGKRREVPVHPELGEILEAWGREGFELLTGRRPTPDDFIVPNVGKRAKKPHHTRSSYYKAFVRSAVAADVRPRSLHSTRHTFITLTRRGGADKDLVRKITHNPKGDIVDRYTHWEWEPLCNAVLCLDLDVRPNLHSPSGNSGKSASFPRWLGERNSRILPPKSPKEPGSIPRASTTIQQETRGAEKPRQEPRQRLSGNDRVIDVTGGRVSGGDFGSLGSIGTEPAPPAREQGAPASSSTEWWRWGQKLGGPRESWRWGEKIGGRAGGAPDGTQRDECNGVFGTGEIAPGCRKPRCAASPETRAPNEAALPQPRPAGAIPADHHYSPRSRAFRALSWLWLRGVAE